MRCFSKNRKAFMDSCKCNVLPLNSLSFLNYFSFCDTEAIEEWPESWVIWYLKALCSKYKFYIGVQMQLKFDKANYCRSFISSRRAAGGKKRWWDNAETTTHASLRHGILLSLKIQRLSKVMKNCVRGRRRRSSLPVRQNCIYFK